MTVRNSIRLILFAQVLLLTGCLSESEIANHVTFGIALPSEAKVIATYSDELAFGPHAFLIFDAGPKEIAEFAVAYSGGIPVDDYLKARSELNSGTSWMS